MTKNNENENRHSFDIHFPLKNDNVTCCCNIITW